MKKKLAFFGGSYYMTFESLGPVSLFIYTQKQAWHHVVGCWIAKNPNNPLFSRSPFVSNQPQLFKGWIELFIELVLG